MFIMVLFMHVATYLQRREQCAGDHGERNYHRSMIAMMRKLGTHVIIHLQCSTEVVFRALVSVFVDCRAKPGWVGRFLQTAGEMEKHNTSCTVMALCGRDSERMCAPEALDRCEPHPQSFVVPLTVRRGHE